ncbi:hypothetical protein PMF13cell1_02310 [Blautia producta]|uniref:Uncharacterized protein n=1 Tax=Blautia producta TaxID=33035 RepID=A0A4P6M040_9FIRM|nr:hypothetical protein [Blautia producta]QBE96763.1 hypothetical protein PMF13cell1_02310 [Blautia producta]
MAFSEKLKSEIELYCNNHLATDSWYENEFSFIQDMELKNRIIAEFKAIRFAYKLYEGIEATQENLIFEVRNQILAYASIYEAVIENVLSTYYSNTTEFDSLMHHVVPIKISIPENMQHILQEALSHDGKIIVPFYYDRKKKEKPQVRFDDKCRTAESLGLIHKFLNNYGVEVDLPSEIIEIYSYRNGIHIIAEQRKGINYELELSKKAYRRMRPFIDQLKEKLVEDGKI